MSTRAVNMNVEEDVCRPTKLSPTTATDLTVAEETNSSEAKPTTSSQPNTNTVDLRGFAVERILFVDPQNKSFAFCGKPASSEETAVALVEKAPLTELSLPKLFSDTVQLTRNFTNDIYSQSSLTAVESCGDCRLTLVHPATEKHIQKYSRHPMHLVVERPVDYEEITRPFIQSHSLETAWVQNILDGRSEAERVIHSDGDPERGFLLLPDLKWDQRDLESLYVLAIARRKDVQSLRDLSAQHLPLLRNILTAGRQAIWEKYGVARDRLRCYVHYQPSYYHFHVHFTHLGHHRPPKTGVGEAHLLEEVIDNLEAVDPLYYRKRMLCFVLSEGSPLWKEFASKQCRSTYHSQLTSC